MHSHSYSCLEFKDRDAAVYERLLNEIGRYQRELEKLSVDIDNAIGVEPY